MNLTAKLYYLHNLNSGFLKIFQKVLGYGLFQIGNKIIHILNAHT